MRVLVCGGRTYSNRTWVYEILDTLHAKRQITMIIHGGASGADSFAGCWASLRAVPYSCFPVLASDWEKYGGRAGNVRNAQMLSEGKPDLVIAFPGGSGTVDMVEKAKLAGVPVKRFKDGRSAQFPDVPF